MSTEELRTSEAARALGLSAAMLRRHAVAYEQVFGPLPTDGLGRKFDRETLTRIQEAVEQYHQGLTPSVVAALELIRDGKAPEVPLPKEPDRLDMLTEMVRVLTNEVIRSQAELRALRETVERQDEQLRALAAPSDDKAAYVAEMEQIHTDEELEEERRRVRELNRRIEYLHQELDRRSNQAQQVRRPWWKVW